MKFLQTTQAHCHLNQLIILCMRDWFEGPFLKKSYTKIYLRGKLADM